MNGDFERNHDDILRVRSFQPRRSRWPGLLAAALIAGAVGALAISSLRDDDRQARPVEPLATAAASAAADASITAAVKAALQTDPAIGLLPIEVATQGGVVTLTGAAPDETARERAGTLAAASTGVRGVDNQLVVASPRS